MTLQKIYSAVCDAALISTAADALQWDERTGMPAAGSEYRSEQVAALRTRAHELSTEPQLQDWLSTSDDELGVAPESVDAGNLRLLRRDIAKQSVLPSELVHRTAKLTSRGQSVWQTARAKNDFQSLAPVLEQIFDARREAGELLSSISGGSAYDGLLDEYEPDARSDQIASVFAAMRPALVQLIAEHTTPPGDPDAAVMRQSFAIDGQRRLAHWAAETIGFDFGRGRLDETTHPFCTTLGPNDIRILSRYETDWLPGGLYGSLHEAGHGMYEQGLPVDSFGLPAGTYASLGVHESQSRLWENQVGRSPGFVRMCHRQMESIFGKLDFAPETMHRGVNTVTPSLIRVEADETTYNLHVMIRFDLERAIIDRELSVADLPDAWNTRYRDDLGVTVPDDTHGVLQDVHWSAGLIGYFPTYTIGNLLSAMLFDAAANTLQLDADDLDAESLARLKVWMADRVYRHGRLASTDSIAKSIDPDGLSHRPLLDYLRAKHSRNQSNVSAAE